MMLLAVPNAVESCLMDALDLSQDRAQCHTLGPTAACLDLSICIADVKQHGLPAM